MNCIEHTQKGGPRGYAMARYLGKQMHMHRRVYCEHNNVHPDAIVGLVIRHTCDNPRCINPEHLIVGTHQDNMDDMVSRNRAATGTSHGLSKLNESAVRFIRTYYVNRSREFGIPALARKFGVGTSVVHDVLTGKTWTSISTHQIDTN